MACAASRPALAPGTWLGVTGGAGAPCCVQLELAGSCAGVGCVGDESMSMGVGIAMVGCGGGVAMPGGTDIAAVMLVILPCKGCVTCVKFALSGYGQPKPA